MVERIPLKRIIPISPAAPNPLVERGQQIRRNEKWPPAFRLVDVNPFMLARAVERSLIDAKNNMPQRHGRRAVGQDKTDDASEKKSRNRPVGFKDAIDNASLAAGDEIGEGDEQAGE